MTGDDDGIKSPAPAPGQSVTIEITFDLDSGEYDVTFHTSPPGGSVEWERVKGWLRQVFEQTDCQLNGGGTC